MPSDAPLCRHLRWKGFSQAPRSGPGLDAVIEANHVPYTCLMTCMPWGPDDQPALPEGCSGPRPCFEPHGLRRA